MNLQNRKKKEYLDKVEEKTKNCKLRIESKIDKFYIKKYSRDLRKKKNLTRNDFNKAVEEINKENKEDKDKIQEDNKKIIEEYKEELKQLIKEIQQIGIYNMKKYKDTNNINIKFRTS